MKKAQGGRPPTQNQFPGGTGFWPSTDLLEPEPQPGFSLLRYDAMCRAIAEAYAVDEVKALHDKAAAIEHYSRIIKDKEQEERVGKIRVRAFARLGELLADMPKAEGARGNPGGRGAKVVRSTDDTAQPKTLAQMGITRDQSAKAQQLAAVPPAEREAALARPGKPSVDAIIANSSVAPKPSQPSREQRAARAFWMAVAIPVDEGVLAFPAAELFATMDGKMRDEVRHAAPLFLRWLQEGGFDDDGNR